MNVFDFAKILRIKIGKKAKFQAQLSSPSLKYLSPKIIFSEKADCPAVSKEVAQRFLKGETLVFGEQWICPNGKGWTTDFFANYTWPLDSPVFPTPAGVDVKVPWEISRMQHLTQLAWHCVQESNQHELKNASVVFSQQLEDFWKVNPYPRGVNWSCAMDVAIRGVSLLTTWDLFRSRGIHFSQDWESKFCQSLYEHQNFVYGNLEWVREARANHYLANLVGLLFMEIYLPRERSIRNFLKREFFHEVKRQFYEEGSNFEASSAYHRFSSEMVAWGVIALLNLKEEIPQEIQVRIRGMLNFLRALTLPSENLIQIGDNDSGRFLKVAPHYLVDQETGHQENLLNSNEVLGLLELLVEGNVNRESISHLSILFLPMGWAAKLNTNERGGDNLGSNRFNHQNSEHKKVANDSFQPTKVYTHRLVGKQFQSFSFPEFGVYGWRSDESQVTIRCGKLYQELLGAHAHFDQLSVDLYTPETKIQDPGSYVYTSDRSLRNFFRGPKAHFMPRLDAEGFGEAGSKEDMFRYSKLPDGRMIEFTENLFWGSYEWQGCEFQRRVIIEGNTLTIEDCCSTGDLLADAVPSLPFFPVGYRQKGKRVEL